MTKLLICPRCGTHGSTIRHGKTMDGKQRYFCKSCHKSFIAENSPLKGLQHSDHTFKKFIGYMIDDVPLEVIARNLDINIKTTHYYRYLIFNSLKTYQDEFRLSGTILIDETFISIKEKQYKIIRPDGKNIRGLSRNQLCILTIINLQGMCVAKVASRAMAKPLQYIELLNVNIEDLNLIIHDGGTHQYQFMNQYECPKINTSNDITELYTMNLIDSLHSNIKRYLFKHAGYRLKNLQHYLNFFVYRYNQLSKSNTKNTSQLLRAKNVMINDLFQKVRKSEKTVKYITYLNDKGIADILEQK